MLVALTFVLKGRSSLPSSLSRRAAPTHFNFRPGAVVLALFSIMFFKALFVPFLIGVLSINALFIPFARSPIGGEFCVHHRLNLIPT